MSQENSGAERRREPRVEVPEALECRLEMRTRVRLLDISLSGTLLASEAPLPVGTRAQLRTGVASSTFSPSVEVQRAMDRHHGRDQVLALGAVFTDMDEQSRRSLEAFLRKASE
jgi:c-di-GMP-binding flagellar brake protein YcgR